MIARLIFALAPLLVCGQALTPSVSESVTWPGSQLLLSVSFTDSSPSAGIATLQFSVSLPPGITAGTAVGVNDSIVSCGPACVTVSAPVFFGWPIPILTMPLSVSSTAAAGAQEIALVNVTATTAGGMQAPISAGPQIAVLINPATPAATWFTAVSGTTTCRVSKVFQTPWRVSWVCFNTFGASAGSYTADLNGGGLGANSFYIGGFPVANNGASSQLSCLIQLNGTSQALMMLNGALVAANSAVYSCSGFSTIGAGTIGWP